MHYNIKDLRSYLITDYLDSLGLEKVNESGSRWNYFSPFRNESSPSFWVDLENNTWKDFGRDDKGGDVIDLVQFVEKLSRYKAFERVNFLKNNKSVQNIFERAERKEKPQRKAMVLNFRQLESNYLIEYCISRGISEKIAKGYLYQIQYLNPHDQKFVAVGMVNVKGGYEIRSKSFKACIGEKSYTQLTQRPFSKKVMVFEGMFDFLSMMQIKKIDSFYNIGANIIVLHSLSCINHIDLKNYETIDLFLDNDDAGIKATEKLIEQYQEKQIIDFSKILYPNAKDLNEFLLCQRPQK